jgi:aminobenzoyl-glutamate transport protein
VKMSSEYMATMGGSIVLAFVAAQFITFFSWSNMGLIVAIKGADLLKMIGFTGIPLMIAFIGVTASINLFIGSASAKWAIMGPVFIPMFMLMGYSPELVQASYRIGDSVTNIISPLLPYFPIIIAFAKKYDPRIGLGTLISTMLPYSVAFGIIWVLMLSVWMLLGLPLGPDVNLYYTNP